MTFPEHGHTIPALIREQADRRGDAEMVVCRDERLSYRQAEARSAALARGLLAAGVGKGTRVGLLMLNGTDWVLAWLAASRIGALVVPICTFYRAAELHRALRHADVQILLTAAGILGQDLLSRLEQAVPGLAGQRSALLYSSAQPHLRRIWVWGEGERSWARPGPQGLASLADAHPVVDGDFLREVESCVAPTDPAVLIYTSGSSAEPKGALHSHGTLVRHAHQLNRRRGLRRDDRLYTPMPLFWVGGFHTGLIACMDAGACLLCEQSFEPEQTLAFLERERATLVLGWPHHGEALAGHPSFAGRDLSSLRTGARNALPPPQAPFVDPQLRPNWLGMTETFGPHCAGQMDEVLPESRRGSFGTPLPGIQHKLVDPASGETLLEAGEGEICVRGYCVMQRLYKVEREQTFDREGFYHTGDGGYFGPGGDIFFTGRLGEMIKTGGANVAPREVERVLESFHEVAEAYVVGTPDPSRGQIVAAAVVPRAGERPDADELRLRLKAELSAFKVPRHVFVCAKAELPRTATGKIQKHRLRDQLARRIEALV